MSSKCTHYKSNGQKVPVCLKSGETLESTHRKYADTTNRRRSFNGPGGKGTWQSVNSLAYAQVQPHHFRQAKIVRPQKSSRDSSTRFIAETTNSKTYITTAELTGKYHMKPERVSACEKSVLSQPDVFGRDAHNSSAQVDFGVHTPGVPTTHDLNDGCPKNSHHLPNYDGHVPASQKNKKMMQILSEGKKMNKNIPNWESTAKINMSGYTGYTPQSAVNVIGPFQCGTDTTSGRANVEGLGKIMS